MNHTFAHSEISSFSRSSVPVSTSYDAVIVGAGHNGLVCAAYLAQAGLKVAVLEKQPRIGGACTMRKWTVDDKELYFSPCAYLAGLFHPLVMQELRLEAHGLRWTSANAGFFVPFTGGTSVLFHDDPAITHQELRKQFPDDVDGWIALQALCDQIRDALRGTNSETGAYDPSKDTWIGPSPSHAELEERLKDENAVNAVFHWSIRELLDRYLKSEKLKLALIGQGVIGSAASPEEPGTAYIFLHHLLGNMQGTVGTWGYIEGGMGRLSALLCSLAEAHGATICTQRAVRSIVPGKAPQVICNADPRAVLAMLGPYADSTWKQKVLSIPQEGCSMKINLAMRHLPQFSSRPNDARVYLSQVELVPDSMEQWRLAYQAVRRGDLPETMFIEMYFQTHVDMSVSPSGLHHVSMFCQPVPYRLAHGTWDTRRTEALELGLRLLGRHCTNLAADLVAAEVFSPYDIEQEIGLSGGHIFQGECLPDYMWDRRLPCETPMQGVTLCGAATHPGGSVIGINGRNAATALLRKRDQKWILSM